MKELKKMEKYKIVLKKVPPVLHLQNPVFVKMKNEKNVKMN